ncbi:MAG: hypothetical protein WD022_04895 [Balneolaceae bacterium]
MNNLSIGSIITNGFKIGFKNIIQVIGALILYVLTVWIPYLNVGTTIGIYSIVPALSKGEHFKPTSIFASENRDKMGGFFLLLGFLYLGVTIGMIFLVIPAIVIGVAWGLAIYLFIDQGTSPLESLSKSYELTYGHKWTIFLGVFILSLIIGIVVAILTFIGQMFSEAFAIVLTVIAYLIAIPVCVGAYAHIYGVLAGNNAAPYEAEGNFA